MQAHESLKRFSLYLRETFHAKIYALALIKSSSVGFRFLGPVAIRRYTYPTWDMIDLHAHVDSGIVGYRVGYPAENVRSERKLDMNPFVLRHPEH